MAKQTDVSPQTRPNGFRMAATLARYGSAEGPAVHPNPDTRPAPLSDSIAAAWRESSSACAVRMTARTTFPGKR